MVTAVELVNRFNMLPHPEGGFYARTYSSSGFVPVHSLPEGFSGSRPFSTAIYFLLEKGNFSAFHRIKSDECWHFYTGQCLLIHMIDPRGVLTTTKLGTTINEGETFQFVVPAGSWFASEPAPSAAFSFVGCTVAPGFDFEDFELAYSNELVKLYPQHQSLIKRLCRQ